MKIEEELIEEDEFSVIKAVTITLPNSIPKHECFKCHLKLPEEEAISALMKEPGVKSSLKIIEDLSSPSPK